MLSEIKAELANQSGGNFHVTFPLIPNLRQDFDEFCTFFKFWSIYDHIFRNRVSKVNFYANWELQKRQNLFETSSKFSNNPHFQKLPIGQNHLRILRHSFRRVKKRFKSQKWPLKQQLPSWRLKLRISRNSSKPREIEASLARFEGKLIL